MGNPDEPGTTLAWPDHDRGPTPPPDSRAAHRDERATRKPLPAWDRIKFLLFFGVAWLVLVWNAMSNNALMPFSDAARQQVRSGVWVLVLGCLELVRQGHYLLSENLAWYHRFWTEKVFGGMNRQVGRLNDWNRYRIARVCKWLTVVAVIGIVLGRIYKVSPVQGLFRLPHAIWHSMPFVMQAVFILFIAVAQFGAIFWFLSRGGTDVYFPDDIKTRFTDVWGQDAVLDRVKENMVFLEKPESIEEKGGYVPGGILLWGPPGTGKTLMAEAVAGETGKPFVFVDPGAFINMFFGVGILKVKGLFRKLRKLAVRYGGVIVFFDEADSLGNRGAIAQGGWNGPMSPFTPGASGGAAPCRGSSYLSHHALGTLTRDMLPSTPEPPQRGLLRRFVMGAGMGGGGGGMGTLQALLTELSGLKKPRGFINRVVRRVLGMKPKPPPRYRILVMMATNMPQALDEALLRPGRIDRIYRVGYPSKEGRKRTYQGYLDKVSHEITPEQVDKLATITPYATGATIKDLVNESLIVAIRSGRETITWRDIIKAKLLKSLGPPEDVEYIERERHAVAVHEACHAVASYYLQKNLTIDIATIEKGQSYLGLVAEIPIEEQFTSWRTEYESDIMVSIASLVGEKMFFEGDNSSGVSADLMNATTLAMYMHGMWGMGATIGSHGVSKGGNEMSVSDGVSRSWLETPLGQRAEAMLTELYERTEALLREHRRDVLAVAHALETHKTLTGEDIEAVIKGTQGPLVDGRPYRLPEFMVLAEHYHERAVAAHKASSRVEVPLPSHTGLTFARPPVPVEDAAGSENGAEHGTEAENGNGNGNGNGKRRRRDLEVWMEGDEDRDVPSWVDANGVLEASEAPPRPSRPRRRRS